MYDCAFSQEMETMIPESSIPRKVVPLPFIWSMQSNCKHFSKSEKQVLEQKALPHCPSLEPQYINPCQISIMGYPLKYGTQVWTREENSLRERAGLAED